MSDTAHSDSLAVELRHVDKSFYGVLANADVDFELRRGEVHALLGENGAGKSTLCSIIAGLYRPDSGEMHLEGELAHFKSPKDALAAGVGMVYQHFRLVANLTVAENLALGNPDVALRLSMGELEEEARELGERYEFPVDPSARIWKLLYRNAKILILDEPTAVLTPQEGDALFRTMRLMVDEGRSVIFVSHKLQEVKQVSDRVTVLREGRVVGGADTADAEPRDLARMMVGKDLELPSRSPNETMGEVRLSITDLYVEDDRGLDAVQGIQLDVRAGEVVGIAGVSGNGQRELAYGVVGLRKPKSGKVELDGEDVTNASVLNKIRRGIAYVPQSRLGMGLAPGLTTEDNLALKQYRERPYSRGPWLSTKAIDERGSALIEDFDIRGARRGLPIKLLSGGNLQKALIAREVTQDHQVLIARSPTRGLDVGATASVRDQILAERDRGIAVLLISEDLDELLALSDRLLVIYEGRIVGEMPATEATPGRLGLLMSGHDEGTPA